MVIVERNAKKYHRSVEDIQKHIDDGTPLYSKYFDIMENAEIEWRDPRSSQTK